MIRGKNLTSASVICSIIFSSFDACCFANLTSLNLPCLNNAISLAFFSSLMTINSSPAFGTSDNPIISAGIDGVACLIFLPFSSSIALIFPDAFPASNVSDIFIVPD